jgi:hypothetical protein
VRARRCAGRATAREIAVVAAVLEAGSEKAAAHLLAQRTRARAAVIGIVTEADRGPAAAVVDALRTGSVGIVAVGGAAATGGLSLADGVLELPERVVDASAAIAQGVVASVLSGTPSGSSAVGTTSSHNLVQVIRRDPTCAWCVGGFRSRQYCRARQSTQGRLGPTSPRSSTRHMGTMYKVRLVNVASPSP